MNLVQNFGNQNINKILKVHNYIYGLRETANNRDSKLHALSEQIRFLNAMNRGGAIQLELPKDFVQHFLDDEDLDNIWAATHITRGKGNRNSILGDMKQVWKIFNYLDFVRRPKKDHDKKEQKSDADFR